MAEERQWTWRRSSPGTYSRSAWNARSLIDSCWLVAPSRSLASPPAKTATSVTRGDTRSSSAATELVTATHQTDRIGLLVGHGSDGVHSARHLGELDHLLVPRERPQERQAQSHAAGAHGHHDAREQHRDRARLDREHRDRGRGSHGGPVLPQHERRRHRAGQHLPRERHQQQPERNGGQQRELLPVQPHGEDRRDDPRGQDTSAERREQPERAREPRGSQRGEPSCGSAPCAGTVVHARSRGAGTCASRSSMTSSEVVPP